MKMLEILSQETNRTRQAYLYEEQGHWYAYEHSARLMKIVLKETVCIMQVVNETYDICIDRTEIDFGVLVNFPIVECSDTTLVIDCSAIAS